MNPTINQQATGLQVFYNEEANVNIRTEVIDNEAWFVAKDVCEALGIYKHRDALLRLDEDEKGRPVIVDTLGGKQEMTGINESGMYNLIFQSRRPEAKAFRKWVTNVVLPSIRRTGSYSSNGVQPSIEENKKLPLPKYRPYYQEWKDKVTPYLCADDCRKAAEVLEVSYSHVHKVLMGTSMSAPVARTLTLRAKINRENGVRYEEVKPVYEQLSIEWEKEMIEGIDKITL